MTPERTILSRIGDAHDDDDSDALEELLPLVPRPRWDSLLVSAVLAGAVQCVRAYVRAGMDPTAQYEGRTLISAAAGRRSPRMVRLLLELGAPSSGVVLVAAAYSGCLETVTMLLDQGIDPDQGNPGFPTALGTARARGHREIEALLLARGARQEVVPRDP